MYGSLAFAGTTPGPIPPLHGVVFDIFVLTLRQRRNRLIPQRDPQPSGSPAAAINFMIRSVAST